MLVLKLMRLYEAVMEYQVIVKLPCHTNAYPYDLEEQFQECPEYIDRHSTRSTKMSVPH